MTAQEALKAIKAGKFEPLYFLQGEEPYYIDAICSLIEQTALAEHERGFNQTVVYGKDMDMARILTNARRYPMMAERQVVIVKEAQEISNLNHATGQQLLESYAKSPTPSTILVFAHKNKELDKRKALYKALDKHATLITSEKIRESSLMGWIADYAVEKKLKLNQEAIQALAEAIGADLTRIANELDKLSINLKAGDQITAQMVEQYVGFSREYSVWELQRTLAQRNLAKSMRIVRFFGADPKSHPIIPMIAVLFNFFSRVLVTHQYQNQPESSIAAALHVSPYQVKDYLTARRTFNIDHLRYIIRQIRVADARSKGMEAGLYSEQAIMEELVASIIGI